MSAHSTIFSSTTSYYSQQQFMYNLGTFSSDNQRCQSQLALANFLENQAARRELAALHVTESQQYGEREFGFLKKCTDKV